ncbi:hypothetical protein P7K49_015277 [Saguinus oedipus]|uniref:Uncharacterized protein n=1 Tax=Saguinus oedipus TaxID=9490 RepID=A0ABQ9V8S7_SAGOE|nr:hypothetical protein P7K49_015277 [Saguinus oedipus]
MTWPRTADLLLAGRRQNLAEFFSRSYVHPCASSQQLVTSSKGDTAESLLGSVCKPKHYLQSGLVLALMHQPFTPPPAPTWSSLQPFFLRTQFEAATAQAAVPAMFRSVPAWKGTQAMATLSVLKLDSRVCLSLAIC